MSSLAIAYIPKEKCSVSHIYTTSTCQLFTVSSIDGIQSWWNSLNFGNLSDTFCRTLMVALTYFLKRCFHFSQMMTLQLKWCPSASLLSFLFFFSVEKECLKIILQNIILFFFTCGINSFIDLFDKFYYLVFCISLIIFTLASLSRFFRNKSKNM